MPRSSSFVLSVLLVIVVPLAAAAPPATLVNTEIVALLDRLVASGCSFNRNGMWYSATEAEEHLLLKRNYFEAKEPLPSAEKFIELAASKSMITGRPYLVRCQNAEPVKSSVWLLLQLQAIRSTGADLAPGQSEQSPGGLQPESANRDDSRVPAIWP